jgi:hypothetical protein
LLLSALLTIRIELRHGLLELVEVQALQLSSVGSSSNSGELLLELLLTLSEEQAGKLKLFHYVGVHLSLLAVEGRWGQDLLGHRIHVLLLLLTLLLLLLLTTTVVVATEASSGG